jgi:RNA recognition motif-containing protein
MENCSIYIKNIPKAYLDIEKLKTLFSKYGTITFAQLYKDKGRHFAILAFTDSENAKKAKEEMNNKKLNEKDELPLYVDMLQKKSERKRMLITKIVDNNNKLNQETKNCNLYIKNLPLTLKEEAKMKEIFSKIGPVKSVKIDKYILQTKRGDKDLDILSSSGFGYVCYNNEEDAKKAIEEFNNKKLPGYENSPRPVLISFFQPKSERKQVISKMLAQQNMAPIPMSPYPYPFMIPIPRPMMNRNNYKNTYHKPQQRSQQQNINANRPKVNQETDNRDSFGTSSINKEDEPNYEHMKSLANEELQKDYLGEFLFKKIEQHPLAQSKNLDVDTISRITGMILGIGNLDEIYEITTKNEYIEGRIKEALALLGIK